MFLKNKISFVALVFFSSLLFLSPAFALSPDKDSLLQGAGKTAGFETNVSNTTISERAGQIIGGITALVGSIFLILTIYAGVLWMTASGNDEKVKQATSILKSSLIGLIIVVSAYSITSFALKSFGGKTKASSCSGYTNPADCNADNDCEWAGTSQSGEYCDEIIK